MERGHELRAESTRILDERLGTRVGERDGRMENFRRAEEEGGRIINDRAIIFITGEGMKGKGDFWKANAIRKDDWKGLLGRNFRSADTQGRETELLEICQANGPDIHTRSFRNASKGEETR